MAKDDWKTALVKLLPWKKFRRYELANLSFELLAFYFVLRYTGHQPNAYLNTGLWVLVLGMGLGCVMWACKQ